jgi:serine/threonine protein kinase
MQGQSQFPDSGDTVAGRFVIDSQLGAGASSRVYAATQTRLDRRVALKITKIPPPRDSETFERWAQRFERGARILSELENPYVVDVIDFGETENGQLFMAMELVDGRTLKQAVQEETLDVDAAARLGLKLLEALAEAHEHGVLHRDVKPDNIMLTGDDEVRLLDFGVAKPMEKDAAPDQPELTQEGIFVGTPRYAAPEYLLGGKLGPWCDIYSLGLVLWEAVTGSPVVLEEDTQASLRRHMVPEPFDLDPDLVGDRTFTEIICKMTEKDPRERYRSAPEVSAALRAFLEGEDLLTSGDLNTGQVPIDPNLQHPSEFFVNAPESVSPNATSESSSDRHPDFGGKSTVKMPSARAQQRRADAKEDVSLVSQSIAESHEDEPSDTQHPGRERSGSAREKTSSDDESVPVPAHVEQMLEKGERKADRWHTFKWLAVAAVVLLIGGVVALWLFAPQSWQNRLGLTELVDAGERNVVHPVQDRVAPEHSEVSAEGIYRVVESSNWKKTSDRGEIQSEDMLGWTQDFEKDGARIRVEVYRFDSRAAARERIEEVDEPNRAVRFARRTAVLKPLDDQNPDSVESLQLLLQGYRDMVDSASGSSSD